MSIETVRAYFKALGRENEVMEVPGSSATVPLAAQALGVEEGRIAKSMMLKPTDEMYHIIVAAGDVKIDNRKYKDHFQKKVRICPPEEMVALTGHPLGGNCPFALKTPVDVFLDVSLKRFATVYPACGSSNSMIALTPDELAQYGNALAWVDVCKPMEAPAF